MKQKIPCTLFSLLLSANSVFAETVPAPSWPDIWKELNPPSVLDEVNPGEAVAYGDNQKWIYMNNPATSRYLAGENGYTGDIYLFSDLGDGSVQNVAMYGAASVLHGNVNIYLQSGTFYTVYGGGRGAGKDAVVDGSTHITVGGTTAIYTEQVSNTKAIYGGGYADAGYSSIVKGGSNIHITGTSTFDIYSSVYGGGYTNMTDGNTIVEGGSRILIDGGVVGSSLKVQGGGWAYEHGTSRVTGGSHIELVDGGYAAYIYGGGRTSGTPNEGVSIIDKVLIDVTGGEAGSVLGGGESNWFGNTQVTDGVVINVSGGVIKDNLAGGGEVNGDSTALLKGHAQVKGGVSLNISGMAQVGDVYGGGMFFDKGVASTVEGGSVITMTGGSAGNVHGGGALYATATQTSKNDYHLLVSVDNSTVNIKGGTVSGNVFGGGEAVVDMTNYTAASTALNEVGSTNVNISGGVIGKANLNYNYCWDDGQVYGGGDGTNANVLGDTHVAVTGGVMGSVSGGGKGANIIGGNTYVSVSGDNTKLFDNLYGGSIGATKDQQAVIMGSTYVTVNLTNVLEDLNPKTTDPTTVQGSVICNVYGGGQSYSTIKGDTHLTIENGTFVNNVIAGGHGGWIEGNTNLVVNAGTFGRQGEDTRVGVSGGSYTDGVNGNTSVMINGGTFHDNVDITGASASSWSKIGGNTSVVIAGGTINGNVIGGGSYQVADRSSIGGNTSVLVKGGAISGDIYAGSSVDQYTVAGNAVLTFQGNDWTASGHLHGGVANGTKTLELSGVTVAFGDKVSAADVSGFDGMKLTNGTVQDIAGLAAYGLTVDVGSGATLAWKDTSSATVSTHLNQGGYFDANGADLSSVKLGEGQYSWLTCNGGAIVNFSHTEAPVDVTAHVAAIEGDTLTVLSISDGITVAAAGGKVDISQVVSEQPVVLGSYNDATQRETAAQVLMDGSKASTIVADQLAVECDNTTVISKGSSIEANSLVVSGSGTVLENNGDMSKIASLNVADGILKGSGSFGAVTMTGGSLVVGSSPGIQTFLSLELKSTVNTVFSINGTAANDGLLTGWGTETYSNLTVGQQLTLDAGITFTLEFGKTFLAGLEEGREYTFDLVFCNALQGDLSGVNLAYTEYDIAAGTSSSISSPFSDGRLVSTGTGIQFVGTALAQSIPETSSVALGLAGLMVFSLRRRRLSL